MDDLERALRDVPAEEINKEPEIKADVVEEVVETTEASTEAETQAKEFVFDEVAAFFEKDGNDLKYLSKKLGRELTSYDELTEVKEIEKIKEVEKEITDAEVKEFYDYKLKTQKGLDSYLRAKKDWKSQPQEAVVKEYLQEVEGYSSEEASKYYKLTYKLNKDDYDEEVVELAELQHGKDYRKAVKFFEEQQKEFFKPSEKADLQRQAEEQEQANRIKFAQGVTSAVENLKSIKVGDFEYKVEADAKFAESISTPENIMRKWSNGDVFDYDGMARDLYSAANIESIVTARTDKAIADYIQAEKAELENRTDPNKKTNAISTTTDEADAERTAHKIFG